MYPSSFSWFFNQSFSNFSSFFKKDLRLKVNCILLILGICTSHMATATTTNTTSVPDHNIPKMPKNTTLDANFAIFNTTDGIRDYASVGNIKLKWNQDVDLGLKGLFLGISASSTGKISINGNATFVLEDGGRFEVGNKDWASTTLGVDPTSISVGRIYAAGSWQSAMYLESSEKAMGIGRIESNESFLASAFYLTPRISYYTPKVGRMEFGASLGYGGTPSRAFLLDGTHLGLTKAKDFGDIVYKALGSAGALYSGEMFDVSLTANVAIGTPEVITTGITGGVAVKGQPVELAVALGYLSNDPRIDDPIIVNRTASAGAQHLLHNYNSGYFLEMATAYTIKKVRFGLSSFTGSSYDYENDIGSSRSDVMAAMFGVEYTGALSVVNLIPFVELGYFRNRYALFPKSDTATSIPFVEVVSGPMGFFGLKAKMSLS